MPGRGDLGRGGVTRTSLGRDTAAVSARADAGAMDVIRFGLGVRALRHRRGWRQEDLAAAAGVSRSVIWRIERGFADRVPVARLEGVMAALGARVNVRLDWNGQGLDRLLDGDHALLVEAVVAHLIARGWQCSTEVTFSTYGERGAVDILAWYPDTRLLLVVEVKTVVPDVGGMLATLDRKHRLGPGMARERGWVASAVSRVLVIRDGSTVRRHVAALPTTFGEAFPDRTVAVKRWVARPAGAISGIWFFPIAQRRSGIQRVRAPRGRAERGDLAGTRQPPANRTTRENFPG